MSGHNIWFPLEQIFHVSCLIRKILNQGSQQWYTYDSKMLRTTQNGPRHFLEGFFLTLKVWNVNVFERNIFRWHIFPQKNLSCNRIYEERSICGSKMPGILRWYIFQPKMSKVPEKWRLQSSRRAYFWLWKFDV